MSNARLRQSLYKVYDENTQLNQENEILKNEIKRLRNYIDDHNETVFLRRINIHSCAQPGRRQKVVATKRRKCGKRRDRLAAAALIGSIGAGSALCAAACLALFGLLTMHNTIALLGAAAFWFIITFIITYWRLNHA